MVFDRVRNMLVHFSEQQILEMMINNEAGLTYQVLIGASSISCS